MRAQPDKRKRPTNVQIAERDIELFDALYKLGVMTRLQIQQYTDRHCVSEINRRLRKLYDTGHVDRRFLPRQFGSTPAVYMIGSKGTAILAGKDQAHSTIIERRRYRFKRISDNSLPHELMISEFACLLKGTFRRYSNCDLLAWECDEELVGKCNIIASGADLELKPDAYGSYHLHKTLYNFFLEADMGNEPISRINMKVEFYRSFKASGLFQNNFNRQAFRLLIVTNSGSRAKNICQSLPVSNDLKIFVGNIDAMRIDPLLAPLWLVPGHSKAVSLHSAAALSIEGGDL